MAVYITILAVFALIVGTNKKAKAWLMSKGSGAGFTNPKILIALGLIVFNLVIWSMIPWFWDILVNTWYAFAFFNIGLWVVLYLNTIKIKDQAGNDTKEADPTASKMATFITAVLIIGLITTTVYKIRENWGKPGTTSANAIRSVTRVSNTDSSHGVPMGVALRVIAECESGGKQFEPDGVTPLKNKGIPEKGIKPSGAFGKYQFKEMHREPAKKLATEFPNINYNLDTEEGQDNYARHLYAESGTKHWEFDEEHGGGRACWGPKLRAWTWGGEMVTMTVVAPTDKWSDEIPTPYAPRRYELEGFGKKYTVLWNGNREEDFPQDQRVEQKGIIYNFRLKSRESGATPIVVKFF